MVIWFIMLFVLGLREIIQYPDVFRAVNPLYAIKLLSIYPRGFWILGSVFLCTTGAEALYSDLGHCGRKNIRITWIYVKICLVINYFGQRSGSCTQVTDSRKKTAFLKSCLLFRVPGL